MSATRPPLILHDLILISSGNIAKLSSSTSTHLTSLQREILRFVVIIAALATLVAIIVVIVWAAWLRKDYPGYINVPTLLIDVVSVIVKRVHSHVLPVPHIRNLTINLIAADPWEEDDPEAFRTARAIREVIEKRITYGPIHAKRRGLDHLTIRQCLVWGNETWLSNNVGKLVIIE